jgi:hypothetical protein
MNPVPVGTRIRVLRNYNCHSYSIGGVYTVIHHDPRDGTFRAADASGRAGNWLRWEECEPADGSLWPRIATDMPEDLVIFLSCFDGIRGLRLRERVIDGVLEGIPDLHEKVIALARTPAGRAMISANLPSSHDAEDDD